MELNFFEKLWKNFVSNGSTKTKKNLDLYDGLEHRETPISFHIGKYYKLHRLQIFKEKNLLLQSRRTGVQAK